MSEFFSPDTPQHRQFRNKVDMKGYIAREFGISDPIELDRALAVYDYALVKSARELGILADPTENILRAGFDLEEAVWSTSRKGYYFAENAITDQVCRALADEMSGLNLELGDHITNPIWPGTKREVRQLHERFYASLWDPKVPVAKAITETMATEVALMKYIDPVLSAWLPNEVGYQRYRSSDDWISPHRDRRNDQILAWTITIAGSARVLIYEPIDDPDDYKNLRVVDEFRTGRGSAMFLRAKGLENGEQVIHEVRPPEQGSRLILNLRMRPDILPPPAEYESRYLR